MKWLAKAVATGFMLLSTSAGVSAEALCNVTAKVFDPYSLYRHYDQNPFLKGDSRFPNRQLISTTHISRGGGDFFICVVLKSGVSLQDVVSLSPGDDVNVHNSLGRLIGTREVNPEISRSISLLLTRRRYSEGETIAIQVLAGGAGLGVSTAGATLFGSAFLLAELTAVVGAPMIGAALKQKDPARVVEKAVIQELFSKPGGTIEKRLRLTVLAGDRYLSELIFLRVSINGTTYRYLLSEVRYLLVEEPK